MTTLTTARAAHELTLDEARLAHPVHLRAVVTLYDPYIDLRRPAFFVSDSSGSVFVALASTPAAGFRTGDLVEVDGVSGAGDYAPIVEQASAHKVGESRFPSAAPRVSMTDLLTGGEDGQWVEIEGVVYSVRESDKDVFFDLALRDGVLSALTVKRSGVDYTRLIDAKVVLRGNAAPIFNHQGQLTGAHMLFPDLTTMRIEEAATPDPFTLPVARVGSLLRYTPNTGFQHRAHIRGIVTLFWPGRLLCVQDGARGLCAQTEQSSALNIGDGVDVIGFPVIGEFTPTLLHAVFLRRAVGQPVPALPTSAEQALSGNHDAQAVAIDGQLIGENEGTEDPTLVFSSGNFIFSAVLPRQSRTSALDSLEVGSRVRILGVCSVQSDGAPSASGAGFTVAKSFRILLRSSGDVVVLQRPSWWNAEHTLRVLAVALAITLVALGGVVVLQQRVRLQSKVIHAQLVETAALKDAAEAAHKAAEFQATHDGLTGVLNRTAIFELLHREFELASRSGATTGVMMIDLDHFKRINDRFGHLTGDEVLKQAVTRVRDSVRSSDLVGRYGGEEFLIVLPHCDKLQIQTCAERIRLAISSLPIIADGNSLSVTTSVGATVAILPFHSEQEALSAADMALYHAKNNGRNRVVLFDLESRRVTEPTQAIAQATSQHA